LRSFGKPRRGDVDRREGAMPSEAARNLALLRQSRVPPEAHLRGILSIGLERDPAHTSGRAARTHIAALVQAVPNNRFAHVEFQYARSVPHAFTVHALADDSYAIGMDADIEEYLRLVFFAAVAAYETQKFQLFASCATELFGVYYVGRQSRETEEGIGQLCGLYKNSPEWRRAMTDTFRDAAAQFLISHELAHVHLDHFAEGGALQVGSGFELSAFPDKAREFGADEWAAEWTLKAAGNDVVRQTLGVVAPLLCMCILSFVSVIGARGAGITKTFEDAHPSNAERAARLRTFASRQLHVPPTDALKLLVNVDQFLESEIRKIAR
jgi:hypothetical protein